MLDLGDALPGTDLASTAAQLRAAPWPEDLRNTPIIIDTDIGGDADDALALAAAARHQPLLALVTTGDETRPPIGHGERARFARWLLDTLGRTDVPTAAGPAITNPYSASTARSGPPAGGDYYCVHGLIPDTVAGQPHGPDAVLDAVAAVCAATTGPVRWIGMAPLTNLALVLDRAPELAARLRVTQMGGALNYRHPDRAEHNIRLDVPAAHQVIAAVAAARLATPEFIISDVTFTPEMAVDTTHPIYQALLPPGDRPRRAGRDDWPAILHAHLDRWFTSAYPSTIQHDALTLTAALALPFVISSRATVVLDPRGRMTEHPDGAEVRLSRTANYPAFMTWLRHVLNPATPALATSPEGAPTTRSRWPA